MLHIDVPVRNEGLDALDRHMADWETLNNNEPFWRGLHSMDLAGAGRRGRVRPRGSIRRVLRHGARCLHQSPPWWMFGRNQGIVMTDVAPRPRIAKGARPLFLEPPHGETLLGMVLSLAAEVSTLADEVDELREELARARPDGGTPQSEVAARRAERRRAIIGRLLQVVLAGHRWRGGRAETRRVPGICESLSR
jgi:hypothetical protein